MSTHAYMCLYVCIQMCVCVCEYIHPGPLSILSVEKKVEDTKGL